MKWLLFYWAFVIPGVPLDSGNYVKFQGGDAEERCVVTLGELRTNGFDGFCLDDGNAEDGGGPPGIPPGQVKVPPGLNKKNPPGVPPGRV